jgi:hypothetical protein
MAVLGGSGGGSGVGRGLAVVLEACGAISRVGPWCWGLLPGQEGHLRY